MLGTVFGPVMTWKLDVSVMNVSFFKKQGSGFADCQGLWLSAPALEGGGGTHRHEGIGEELFHERIPSLLDGKRTVRREFGTH
jgi:hypothetical protein